MVGLCTKLPPDDEFQFDLSKCPAKFEIFTAEKNPKLQLIALVSKQGEVVVKRAYWKTAWKRNFAKESVLRRFEEFLTDSSTSSSPQSFIKDSIAGVRWSSDGQVLLICFQSGRVYFLDVQTGRAVFFNKLNYCPSYCRWFRIYRTNKTLKELERRQPVELSSSDFNFNDNSSRDHATLLAEIEPFCRHIFRKSMLGTLLCIVRANEEETILELYAAGVLLIKKVDLRQWLIEEARKTSTQIDPSSLELIDLEFCRPTKKLRLIVKFTSLGVPFLSNQASTSCQMNKATLELDFDFNLFFPTCCKIAHCLVWLIFYSIYFREMLQYSTYNWQLSSKLFHQRLFGEPKQGFINFEDGCPSLRYYNKLTDLFTYLSIGVSSPDLTAFMTRDPALIKKELQIGNSFVDDHFVMLLTGLHSGLEPAANALRQYSIFLRSYQSQIQDLIRQTNSGNETDLLMNYLEAELDRSDVNKEYLCMDSNLSEESSLKDTRYALEQSIISLSRRLEDAAHASIKNRCELKHLLRWMSVVVREVNEQCKPEILEQANLRLISNCIIYALRQFFIDDANKVFAKEGIKDFDGRLLIDFIENNFEQTKLKSDETKLKSQYPSCVFDRVLPFLEGLDNDEKIQKESSIDDGRILTKAEDCFKVVRELYENGVSKMLSEINNTKELKVLSHESILEDD